VVKTVIITELVPVPEDITGKDIPIFVLYQRQNKDSSLQISVKLPWLLKSNLEHKIQKRFLIIRAQKPYWVIKINQLSVLPQKPLQKLKVNENTKLSVRHQLQLQQGIQKTVTTKSGKDSAYISIGTHSLAGRHSILAINFRNVHEDFNQPQHTTKKMAKILAVIN
jgi:hypothetical protein